MLKLKHAKKHTGPRDGEAFNPREWKQRREKAGQYEMRHLFPAKIDPNGIKGGVPSKPLKRGRAKSKPRLLVDQLIVGGLGDSLAVDLEPSEVIPLIKEGLPVEEMVALQGALAISVEQFAGLLGVSNATYHRRKEEDRLTSSESERVLRYARLFGMAVNVLESKEYAREWLGSPQHGLGGEVPLDYARTELGATEVERLLGRIAYGVYS